MAAFFKSLQSPDAQQQETLGDFVRDVFGKHFKDEGNDVTGPWAQLTEWTQDERESQLYDGQHPILRRSGEYRDSFIDAFDSSNIADLIARPEGWTMEFGSSHDYVDELEGGRFNMFERPVTMLSAREADGVGDTLDTIFQKAADDFWMARG